jgi:large subunit ribosomal protein L4
VIAHTKTRAERSGSGIKPWKQKGTGRARIGSSRAPHWRKGGIVFGPRSNRNFIREINRKMRQKATLIALSEKIRSGKFLMVDAFTFPSQKTQEFDTFLKALQVSHRGLVVALDIREKETEE